MFLARSFSHHSLLSSLPQILPLIQNAKEKGYTTIAITDEDTGSGLIEFYDACKKEGVKPVLGATLRIPNQSKENKVFGRNKSFSKIAILAKNELGYRALLELISLARTVQEEPAYHITSKNLIKYIPNNTTVANFYIFLGGNDHEIIQLAREDKIDQSYKILENYCQLFGAQNLILGLAYPLLDESLEIVKKINLQLAQMCKQFQVKFIASPDPRYLEQEDEEAFKVVLAIREQKRLSEINLTRHFNLPSVKQQIENFEYVQEAVDTALIEESIDIQIPTNFDKNADDAYFPIYNLPETQNPADRLRWESYIGLLERYSPEKLDRKEWEEKFIYSDLSSLKEFAAKVTPRPEDLPGYPKEYWQNNNMMSVYIDRVETELEVIITKGYADYFLVFADIMQFCRNNGIVINTRGSAAGCLVGFLTGINILDPLLYNLPFERFLNPFRPSPPDIDGDFADDRRGEVIEYITKKYGNEKVCQIVTFGTMLPKAAIRDVGRVLGISYGKCDKLSKLIPTAPQGKKTSFKWAFQTSQELETVYEKDNEVRRIIDIAKKVEGNFRHASVHAAGVIIAPDTLTKFAPLQWDSEHQMIICQYDMRVAEKAGLVKMDILGITNLSILGNAVELAEQRHQISIDLQKIDTTDKQSFELLAKGRTMGTFQLSGPTMTRYLVELEPTKVQDLMAMVALYRPGPMASIPEYIRRKKNPKLTKYIVPQMEKWMAPSFGIFVYQEDLLFTAIELAGYDWGKVDVLRKGMGKKIQSVIDEQKPIFIEGAINRSGLTREKATEIWEMMVPFGAYGFNKSHSSNYGMVAYWTAYMKANFTVEFMTALMTSEANDLDKIAAAIKECRELNIKVLPPDVNLSYNSFTIDDDRTIRYGLSSVKNLGKDVISFLTEDRKLQGPFLNLESFVERMSKYKGFTKRSLEALIWSGALDSLGAKKYT
jgi:DNA polymerase III subunit alpha